MSVWGYKILPTENENEIKILYNGQQIYTFYVGVISNKKTQM